MFQLASAMLFFVIETHFSPTQQTHEHFIRLGITEFTEVIVVVSLKVDYFLGQIHEHHRFLHEIERNGLIKVFAFV